MFQNEKGKKEWSVFLFFVFVFVFVFSKMCFYFYLKIVVWLLDYCFVLLLDYVFFFSFWTPFFRKDYRTKRKFLTRCWFQMCWTCFLLFPFPFRIVSLFPFSEKKKKKKQIETNQIEQKEEKKWRFRARFNFFTDFQQFEENFSFFFFFCFLSFSCVSFQQFGFDIMKDCRICLEEYEESEMRSFIECGEHWYCLDCLRMHIEVAIKEANLDTLTCPFPDCLISPHEYEIRAFVSSSLYSKSLIFFSLI